jgi:hypothetical protein
MFEAIWSGSQDPDGQRALRGHLTRRPGKDSNSADAEFGRRYEGDQAMAVSFVHQN